MRESKTPDPHLCAQSISKKERGATAAEYIIIIALVGVAIVGALLYFNVEFTKALVGAADELKK